MNYAGQHSGRGRWVFAAAAVLLVIIALLLFLSSRSAPDEGRSVRAASLKSPNQRPVSMRIADKVVVPLALLTMPLRGGEKFVEDARSRSDVFEENKRLKARIAQLSDAEMRANALAMKIKRFENLLSADVGIDIPVQKIAGRVVSENNGPFARSALLNVGAKNGVAVGHAVMTEVGLYGHVVAVGKRSSRVLLLQDINSRIAVISGRSEARAIMVGTYASEPSLAFVARGADWQDGDLVVTSGDEGVLPRGLPVGVVKQRGADTRNVVLATDGEPVDWVWVYPFKPVQSPEDDPADVMPDEGEDKSAPLDAAASPAAPETTPAAASEGQ